MSYAKLRSILFRSFTGLKISEFDGIYGGIESKYEEYEKRDQTDNSTRKRNKTIGCPIVKLLISFARRLLYNYID
jgi:hypothetical protein